MTSWKVRCVPIRRPWTWLTFSHLFVFLHRGHLHHLFQTYCFPWRFWIVPTLLPFFHFPQHLFVLLLLLWHSTWHYLYASLTIPWTSWEYGHFLCHISPLLLTMPTFTKSTTCERNWCSRIGRQRRHRRIINELPLKKWLFWIGPLLSTRHYTALYPEKLASMVTATLPVGVVREKKTEVFILPSPCELSHGLATALDGCLVTSPLLCPLEPRVAALGASLPLV